METTKTFEKQIQNWVELDNQIKIVNEKMKQLKSSKDELTNNLLIFAKDNNLSDKTIHISDGKLKFVSNKVQTPLTFKYLEKSLNECIKNENQVKQIIDYVKQQRETKNVYDIRRYTN